MAPPFCIDKNPGTYEPYRFTLSEKYRQLAKHELGEEDDNRDQALTQMREWIAKHPHIRKCRTDAVFLLRFLRFQKFSIPAAQEALERYLVVRQANPAWYRNMDPRHELIQNILESEVFSLMGRDATGRSVVYCRYGLYDIEKITPLWMFRFTMMLLEVLLDDEEVQIGGYRVWADYSNSSMKHYGILGAPVMQMFLEALNKTMPIRISEIQAAGLPKFGVAVANLFLSFASTEFRESVGCNLTMQDSRKHFEEALWPKQYGGELDTTKLARQLKQRFENKRAELLALDDIDIDIRNYTSWWGQPRVFENCDVGLEGSSEKGGSRKLDMD